LEFEFGKKSKKKKVKPPHGPDLRFWPTQKNRPRGPTTRSPRALATLRLSCGPASSASFPRAHTVTKSSLRRGAWPSYSARPSLYRFPCLDYSWAPVSEPLRGCRARINFPPPPAIAAACRAWRNPKPRPQEIKPPSTRGNPHPVQSCVVPPLLLLHKFLRRCIQLGSKPIAAAALVRCCHTHPLASVIGQGASLGRGGPVGGGDWSVGIPDGARISHRGPADAQPRGRATIVANPR
jgi:hypothetical protein